MSSRLKALLLSPLLVCSTALADSIDFNLHDEALRLTYAAAMGSRSNGLAVEAGMLYHEETENAYHLGLHVTGENWSKAGTFDISIGGRLLMTSPGDFDVAALGLGGELRFSPVHRLGIGGHVYYAPAITSFLDAERYTEFGVRLDYQVLPQAFLYVGYRNIEVEVEQGIEFELDDQGHVGMKLLF